MKKHSFPWPLCLALLGAAQLPLHMWFHILVKASQGERIEEILAGVLTGTVAWAILAIAALVLLRVRPPAKWRDLTVVLSCAGLFLFAVLAVLGVVQFVL